MVDPKAFAGAALLDEGGPKARFVNVKQPDGTTVALPAVAVALFGDHALDRLAGLIEAALDARGLVAVPGRVIGSEGEAPDA